VIWFKTSARGAFETCKLTLCAKVAALTVMKKHVIKRTVSFITFHVLSKMQGQSLLGFEVKFLYI
jgi:hypothetical protein